MSKTKQELIAKRDELQQQLEQKVFELQAADHALEEKDEQIRLKDAAYSEIGNKYTKALNKLAEKEKELSEYKMWDKSEFFAFIDFKKYINKNPIDITSIMDRIEVSKQCDVELLCRCDGDCTQLYYKAKLKQVDKVEDNDMVSKTEMFEFTKWCIIKGWDISSWNELIMLHQETQKQCSIQELYELFKNQK
ncbi:MAG: hypothetical protein EKK61_03525 [Rickettsiales bacterium]|nr:MAG: hypothetical protein EKK61_03525 [Rickettsiales bacterium]